MSKRKDYYATLGVSKEAAADEIKRAYHRLARKHHPDVNPGDRSAEERFKSISEAYHILGNKKRRSQYDQVGHEAFARDFDMSEFVEQFNTMVGGREGAGIGNLLGDLFGRAGQGSKFHVQYRGAEAPRNRPTRAYQARPQRGRDVEATVKLDLEEAIQGTERKITYVRSARCSACDGYGVTAGQTCSCCTGKGKQRIREHAQVRIPPGVKNGGRVKIAGRGEPSSGNVGDLYLRIKVHPHETFSYEGETLRAIVPVAVYEAALGATIEVPTLNGSTRMVIPERTQSGQVFRLRGKGALIPGKVSPGDLLVEVRITLPNKIDAGLTRLLKGFRDHHSYDPRDG